jgi:alanine racemase
MKEQGRPTCAVIDLDALVRNYRTVKSLVGKAQVIAIVKSDGYGHGAVSIAQTLLAEGVNKLGVAIPEEGLKLREAGVTSDILVLGGVFPGQTEMVVRYGMEQTVIDPVGLQALDAEAARQGRRALAHLKTDVGMNRLGPRDEDALEALICAAKSAHHVDVVGFFTHFPNSYEDVALTKTQLALFKRRASKVRNIWPEALIHCASTPAILAFPETHLDAVRAGTALYGYNPSMNPAVSLEPVMSILTRIEQLKTVVAGERVSYYCLWEARRKSRIAVLPIGYADMFLLNGVLYAETLVRGRRCPLAGAVCMDLMMIDVSDLPKVSVGDEVVIIGRQGNERVDLAAYANWTKQGTGIAGFVSVSGRVPRVYVSVK